MKNGNEKVKASLSIPKIAVLGIIITVLAIGGGALGSFITSGKAAEIWKSREEKPEKRIIVPYSEFLINLKPLETIEDSFLRVEMSFSVGSEEDQLMLTAQEAKIRDGIITVLRGKNRETIFSDTEGNLLIKDEIKNKVNQILNDSVVNEVYITNIVMQ